MREMMWKILLRFINARFRIGRFFGILFTLNYSLVIVPITVAVCCGPDFRLFCGLMLFCLGIATSFLFHEICHAWVGHNFGRHAREIGLLPIGGFTLFKKCPGTSLADLFISLAGPLGNGVICIGLAALEIGLLDGDIIERLSQTIELLYGNDTAIENLPFPIVLANALLRINVILLIFNLTPAFPLDGGRVLRICLANFTSQYHAAKVTMYISRVIAVGITTYSFIRDVVGSGCLIDFLDIMLVATFIWHGSKMEVLRSRFQYA